MRILVGMSGGLDSTYAALKLLREGHEVEGAVLIMHDFTDLSAAEEASKAIGIKLHVVDCRDIFSTVIENFVNEYSVARTPNPCIICNPLVKFRALYNYAVDNGFDKIATGHYARVVRVSDGGEEHFALARPKDNKKDQTYMLYRLPEEILSVLMLPLSDELKSDVKELAKSESLAVAERRESQEICFIPDGDYASYIEGIVGVFPEGNFVDVDGNVLGRHKGIIRYTYGQRKGLGVAAGDRIFVTKIDPTNNTITLSKDGSLTDTVKISNIVFSGMSAPVAAFSRRAEVKLRYQAKPVSALVNFEKNGRAILLLDEPVKAVTPGQSAVIYDGDIVLCGGFID